MAAPVTAACGAIASVVAALVEQPVLTGAGLATAGAPLLVTGYRRRRDERRLAARRARALTAPLPPVALPDLVDEVADDVAVEVMETAEPLLVPASIRPYLDSAVTPAAEVEADEALDDAALAEQWPDDAALVGVWSEDEVLTDELVLAEALDDVQLADDVLADETQDEPELEPVPAGRHAGADRPVDARVDTGELQRIWDLGDGPDTGPLPVVPDVAVVDDGRLVTEAPAGKQAVLVPGLSGTGTTQVLAPVLRRPRAGTADDRVLDALLRSEADDLTRLLTMAAGEGRHATTGTVDSSRALPAGPSALTGPDAASGTAATGPDTADAEVAPRTRRRGRHAA